MKKYGSLYGIKVRLDGVSLNAAITACDRLETS